MAHSLFDSNLMTDVQKEKTIVKTLDDIVFEERNKEYGCYKLRYTYQRRLLFSFTLVLSIFLFATLTIYYWKINPLIQNTNNIEDTFTETVMYNPDMIPMLIQMPVIPKEKQVPLIVLSEQKNTTEQLKRLNNKVEMPLVNYKPEFTIVDTAHKTLADDLLQRHKDNLKKEKSYLTDTLVIILEKAPQFPGGNAAIQTYFLKNQRYPVNALLTGIQGSSIVSFVVNEKGIVEDAMVVTGIDPELDKEAIRLVKAMPIWQPAYSKGKPIACMLIMPVEFAIK
jgi:protein TonB